MRSISSLISAILWISMAAGLATVLYLFSSDIYNYLSSYSSYQSSKLLEIPSFILSELYYNSQNNTIFFFIYNRGYTPINISNSLVYLNNIRANISCNDQVIFPGNFTKCYIQLPVYYDGNLYYPSSYNNIITLQFLYGGVSAASLGDFKIDSKSLYSKISVPNITNSGRYLSGWLYRIPITIKENSGKNLIDYQILVTLNTQSLISQGKMRSDCGDIRFTDSDGITLLNYWIESGCNTNNTRIWVKVPYIPANNYATIYLYYGNPSATSLSNPYTTLLLYEDWSSGTLDGWKMYTKEGYTASITTSEGNPPPAVIIYGDAPVGGDMNHFIYKTITKPAGLGLRIIADHAGYHGYYTRDVPVAYFIYSTSGTYIESHGYPGDANNVWIYNDQWLATSPTTLSSTSLWVGFGLMDHWDVNWGQNARFDNIRVMLYTSPEPTVTLGSEQILS